MKMKYIMTLIAGLALATMMAEAKGGGDRVQDCDRECDQTCTEQCTQDGSCAKQATQGKGNSTTGKKARDGSCDN